MKNKALLAMNLQTFAEGDGAEDNGSGVDGAEQPKSAGQLFDEFLKGEGMQAEFDRRIGKGIETARTKWEATKNEELSEAEKLAKMTKAEKDAYNLQKKLDEVAQREKELNTRELQATAKADLAEAGIPSELYTLLDYSDAEKCKASMETLKQTFSDAVEKAVKARIGGSKGLEETRGKAKVSPDEAIMDKYILGR